MIFIFKTGNLFWPVFLMLCFLFHNIIWMLQCSRSCERGIRTREAFCLNNLGRHLPDRECQELPRVVTESCNEFLCPSWSASEWSEVMDHVKFKTPLGLIVNIKIIWTVFFSDYFEAHESKNSSVICWYASQVYK